MSKLICLSLLVAVLFSCGEKKTDVAEVRAKIDTGNRSFMAAVEKADAAAFENIYTEDATLMPANTPAIKGSEGIIGYFDGAMKSGITKLELVTDDVQASTDFAAETGRYKLFAGTNPVDEGKYIVVWKKVGTDWRIHKDIFNSDLPPPPAAAPQQETKQ